MQGQYRDLEALFNQSKSQSNTEKIDFENQERAFYREMAEKQKEINEFKIDLETRSNSVQEREKRINSQFSKRSEELMRQEKSLKAGKQGLANLRREIESKQKSISADRNQLATQRKSLIESERKLKEYAQVLKNQGLQMKQKEKDIQHAAKLLSHEKSKRSSNEDQLKKMVDEE